MPSADSQVAVLNDDGESHSGFVPTLGGLAQTPDCPQELELIHEALLDPVYFGQVVEGFVGKLDIRHTLQNGTENVTGPVAVPLVACKQSTHELSPDNNFRVTAVGKILKDFLRLGIVFLSHEGFPDSKFRLHRIFAIRIGILNRGVFAAGGVETQPLEIITGQKKTDARLFLVAEILGLVVLDQPYGEKVLHPLMVLVPTGHGHEIPRQTGSVPEAFRPDACQRAFAARGRPQGPLVVTQPELKENFHQGSQGAFLVDGHADSADSRIGLSQQPAPGLLVAAGHALPA